MIETPVPSRLGLEPSTQRQVFLLPFPSLLDAVALLEATDSEFVLLLAADFTQSDVPLSDLAERIVRAGCAYFCAWGPGCELIHDLVDETRVHSTPNCFDDESVLMTTWHDDETLADAVFFAVVAATPDGIFATGCDRTILAVSDRDTWLREAEQAALEQLEPNAI